jgi:hypothetical protein
MQQCLWTSKALCQEKEARHKYSLYDDVIGKPRKAEIFSS